MAQQKRFLTRAEKTFDDEILRGYGEMAAFLDVSLSYFTRKILPRLREADILVPRPKANNRPGVRFITWKRLILSWVVMDEGLRKKREFEKS